MNTNNDKANSIGGEKSSIGGDFGKTLERTQEYPPKRVVTVKINREEYMLALKDIPVSVPVSYPIDGRGEV